MAIKEFVLPPSNPKPDARSRTDGKPGIAIIGGGPKGLYALERLSAYLQAQTENRDLEIHLFDYSGNFGPGLIYAPDQPGYLLMNYTSGHINMWPETDPAPVVPAPLSFTDWLSNKHGEPVQADHYASRATVGDYLQHGFEQLVQHRPEGVEVITHRAEVTDLTYAKDGYQVTLRTEKGQEQLTQQFSGILIATGHPVSTFVKSPASPNYTSFIYPVTERLAGIRPQENVLIKGLGLTFIDAVLALTEGRGGQFQKNGDALSYQPSGLEPRQIIPYSRTGLPMFPRTGEQPPEKAPLLFFTEEKLNALPLQGGKIDFANDLLPLIEQEIIYTYYRVCFKNAGEALTPEQDFSRIREQMKRFHRTHPEIPEFHLADLLCPRALSVGKWHQSFMTYLGRLVEAAKAGPNRDPIAAATAKWRDLSEPFNARYSFAGLTPDSHRYFQDYFSGTFNRLAYGPPVANVEKIRALARAGILDFSFVRAPEVEFKANLNCYLIKQRRGTKNKSACYLVDARVPKYDLGKNPPELYRNLLDKGWITLFENTAAGRTFAPGCLNLDRRGCPITVHREPLSGVAVYGTPTEGITYDNDTLSRKRNNFVDHWASGMVQKMESLNNR